LFLNVFLPLALGNLSFIFNTESEISNKTHTRLKV